MNRKEQEIAAEINDVFLRLTEMLWKHVSEFHFPTDSSSLNITEHFLMEFLGKESFASMSKLSQLFHVAPTTTTSIVDRLIQRGYLERRRAQQDRRKVLVTLSEKGKQFYDYHHRQSGEIYTSLLSKLPDKGKKLRHSLSEIIRDLDYLSNHILDI